MRDALQVQDLGEQELLKRLYQFCDPDLIGDDAALLEVVAGHVLVVTTDMLVDRVHFSQQTTTAKDVGWRAAAANLSDLAAMGATPLGITVGLGLPKNLSIKWLEDLYQGMVDCLQQHNTPIVGGDICRSDTTTVSITAFGQVLPTQALKRSHARPGDAIVITGIHGASRAGLELLLHPEQGQDLSDQERHFLIQAHQRPQPRLDVIPILRSVLQPPTTQPNYSNPLATVHYPLSTYSPAAMDTSDGLADAILQICRASNVGAEIDRRQIPLPPSLAHWVSEDQAIKWALYGGEDFELVLCLPMNFAQELVQQLAGAKVIGTITPETTVVLKDSVGAYPDEILSLDKGFQHFE